MRKAKKNPGMSWMWLAAGVAGAYVLYTVLSKKPEVLAAGEEQLEGIAASILADASHPAHAAMTQLKAELDALRSQGAAQEVIDAKARELLALAQQYVPAAETAPPPSSAGFAEGGGLAPMMPIPEPSLEIPPAPEGGAGGAAGASVPMPTPETAPSPTLPPPAAPGARNVPKFKPSPQSAPQSPPSRPSTGNWVTRANIYVPDTMLGLVREVRKAQKTAKQMESLALGLRIPKHESVATFVVRAVALSSDQRSVAASVLMALSKAEKNASERAQIDSRLRLIAAAELIALRDDRYLTGADLSKMRYLYDRDNKALKYDPLTLSQSSTGTSKARPGASGTSGLPSMNARSR
jgi:hypothetical protein